MPAGHVSHKARCSRCVTRMSCWGHDKLAAVCAGPLIAVINAQAQAAMSTINFVNSVAFDSNKNAISVSFIYNSINSTSGAIQTNNLTVPLLTMLPIPFIQVRALSMIAVVYG